MNFNAYNYTTKQSSQVNFRSMGKKKGNFSFDSKVVNDLYKAIVLGDAKDYCFIETKTEYFKLFFDLDINEADLELFKDYKMDEFWSLIINVINKVLTKWIVEPTNNDQTFLQYIYSNRTDIDHKLHLYYPNIIINKGYALALRSLIIDELKNEKLSEGIIDKLDDIVDKSVFEANGLRVLFQKKPGQSGYYVINKSKSTLKNIPTNQIDQLTLTSIRTGRSNINWKHVICDVTQRPKLDVLIDRQKLKNETNVNKPVNEQNKTNDKPYAKPILQQVTDMNFVYDLANNLSYKRIHEYKSWWKFIALCRNYGWKDIAHEISKKSPKYTKKGVDNILKSPSDKCPFTIYSLMKWSKEDNEEEHKKIISKYSIEKIFANELTYNKSDHFDKYADEVYESDYLHDLNLKDHDTFIIKSATGTGKTEVIIKAINELIKKKKCDSISVVASRIVLALNIYGRFQQPLHGQTKNLNLNMRLYSDIDRKTESFRNVKRLVTTPDSLIHVLNSDGQIDNYPDIVFIDEIESMYNYICTSDTLKDKRKEVFTILNSYIKNAKYVFVVDCNVTKTVCNFIKKLRSDHSINVIFNTKKTNDTRYYITNDSCYFYDKVREAIKKKQKIFIGSDIKKETEELKLFIKSLGVSKIAVYNSDTGDLKKNMLKNVNEEWKNYDVVICSPTILYGVDCNVKHFDTVFGYYSKTITANAVYQQLNRVRKNKSKEGLIYIQEWKNSVKHPLPITTEALSRFFFRYRKEFEKNFSLLAIDYTNIGYMNTDDLFTKLYFHYEIERNKCCNNYEERLTKYFTEFGGRVFKIDKPQSKDKKKKFNSQKKKRKEKVEEKDKNLLLEASEKKNEAINLVFEKMKNKKEKFILKANKICKKLKLNKLSDKFISNMQHIKNIEKLTESFDYFTPLDKLVIYNEDNIDGKLERFMKKRDLINEGLNLFFDKGLLSNSIKVSSQKLTKEQDDWVHNNYSDIKLLFRSARNINYDVKTQIKLVNVINSMLKDFFGGYVKINKECNKKNNGTRIYDVEIDSKEFFELYLNSNLRNTDLSDDLMKQIEEHYKNTECSYEDLHGKKMFVDIINKIKVNRENLIHNFPNDLFNEVDFTD